MIIILGRSEGAAAATSNIIMYLILDLWVIPVKVGTEYGCDFRPQEKFLQLICLGLVAHGIGLSRPGIEKWLVQEDIKTMSLVIFQLCFQPLHLFGVNRADRIIQEDKGICSNAKRIIR